MTLQCRELKAWVWSSVESRRDEFAFRDQKLNQLNSNNQWQFAFGFAQNISRTRHEYFKKLSVLCDPVLDIQLLDFCGSVAGAVITMTLAVQQEEGRCQFEGCSCHISPQAAVMLKNIFSGIIFLRIAVEVIVGQWPMVTLGSSGMVWASNLPWSGK